MNIALARIDDGTLAATRPGPLYEVMLDGEKIGWVFKGEATMERRSRGSRVVYKRWTAFRWYVQSQPGDGHRTYGIYYDTRARAVTELVLRHLRRSGDNVPWWYEVHTAAKAAGVV